jgi:SNF2 family DNA or RNA helicase
LASLNFTIPSNSTSAYAFSQPPFHLQVLNHPDLLIVKDQDECKDLDEEIKQEKNGADILDWSQFLPEGYIEGDINQSGKLTVLFQLLSELRSSQDRIVIVSNYTTTLRLLEIFCRAKGFPTVRYEKRTMPFHELKSKD